MLHIGLRRQMFRFSLYFLPVKTVCHKTARKRQSWIKLKARVDIITCVEFALTLVSGVAKLHIPALGF